MKKIHSQAVLLKIKFTAEFRKCTPHNSFPTEKWEGAALALQSDTELGL